VAENHGVVADGHAAILDDDILSHYAVREERM
jgi:hypothetical protein